MTGQTTATMTVDTKVNAMVEQNRVRFPATLDAQSRDAAVSIYKKLLAFEFGQASRLLSERDPEWIKRRKTPSEEFLGWLDIMAKYRAPGERLAILGKLSDYNLFLFFRPVADNVVSFGHDLWQILNQTVEIWTGAVDEKALVLSKLLHIALDPCLTQTVCGVAMLRTIMPISNAFGEKLDAKFLIEVLEKVRLQVEDSIEVQRILNSDVENREYEAHRRFEALVREVTDSVIKEAKAPVVLERRE